MKEIIEKIIKDNLQVYLEDHLNKLPPEKHEEAKKYFNQDMNRIIDFCNNNISLNWVVLNENFIKWLHKSLYPEWYIQYFNDSVWNKLVWMIPGEYKQIDISAKENANKDIYEKVENVWNSMKKLLDDFNKKIKKIENEKQKLDLILLFAVDFVSIHPFGDGNGRIDWILIDLICIINWINPIYLLKLYKQNKKEFILVLNETRKSRNLKYLYDFIDKFNVIG